MECWNLILLIVLLPDQKNKKNIALSENQPKVLHLQSDCHIYNNNFNSKKNINNLKISAVLMAEVLKLGICIVLVMQESGSIKKGAITMYSTVILNIKDTLRVCVPSFLYVIQNNLLYVSASNLDAATYQVCFYLYFYKNYKPT